MHVFDGHKWQAHDIAVFFYSDNSLNKPHKVVLPHYCSKKSKYIKQLPGQDWQCVALRGNDVHASLATLP